MAKKEKRTAAKAKGAKKTLGFKADIGPIREWGLALDKREIVVNQRMETRCDRRRNFRRQPFSGNDSIGGCHTQCCDDFHRFHQCISGTILG